MGLGAELNAVELDEEQAECNNNKPDLRAQESGAVHLVELPTKTLFFSQRSSY